MRSMLACVGNCAGLLLLAILLDVFGLSLLFIGIFANLRVDGRFYGDFLIYSGALVVFISLAFWLMWYMGNVPVRDGKAERKGRLSRLARKFTERMSQRLRGDEGEKCKDDGRDHSQKGTSPPGKASRVTWGRTTGYSNQGYDESPKEERKDRTAFQEYDESLNEDQKTLQFYNHYAEEGQMERTTVQGYDDSLSEDQKDRTAFQGYDDSLSEDQKDRTAFQGYDDSLSEDQKDQRSFQGYDDSLSEDQKDQRSFQGYDDSPTEEEKNQTAVQGYIDSPNEDKKDWTTV